MITCPRCGMTSHNPDDEREGYCGNCHDWTVAPPGGTYPVDDWFAADAEGYDTNEEG